MFARHPYVHNAIPSPRAHILQLFERRRKRREWMLVTRESNSTLKSSNDSRLCSQNADSKEMNETATRIEERQRKRRTVFTGIKGWAHICFKLKQAYGRSPLATLVCVYKLVERRQWQSRSVYALNTTASFMFVQNPRTMPQALSIDIIEAFRRIMRNGLAIYFVWLTSIIKHSIIFQQTSYNSEKVVLIALNVLFFRLYLSATIK